MKNLTLKNIPDALYDRLKRVAEKHRRSINSEILACLERSILPQAVDADDVIAEARRIRQRAGRAPLKTEDLLRARDRGRR